MKVVVHNTLPSSILIANITVCAGAQEVFEEAQVPKAYKKYIVSTEPKKSDNKDSDSKQIDVIATLQAKNGAEIITAVGLLDIESLERLAQLEEASISPRKGVLEAISVEIITLSKGEEADDG